jgi:thiamine-phosphate pyrophosphorylase
VKPVICMITDRRRLESAADDLLVARVAAAARAGVHLVQVRERDLDGGLLAGLVRRCVEAARGTAARIIVNDRVDVALAAGAHGVHLRGNSMPAARVRRMVPAGFLIGRSVHAVQEAARVDSDGGVDYLIFGTVFPTSAKPGTQPAGVGELADVVAAARVPVLAVGGITVDTAAAAAQSGAAGVAAIGLFSDGPEESLRAAVEALAAAFDTPRSVP